MEELYINHRHGKDGSQSAKHSEASSLTFEKHTDPFFNLSIAGLLDRFFEDSKLILELSHRKTTTTTKIPPRLSKHTSALKQILLVCFGSSSASSQRMDSSCS